MSSTLKEITMPNVPTKLPAIETCRRSRQPAEDAWACSARRQCRHVQPADPGIVRSAAKLVRKGGVRDELEQEKPNPPLFGAAIPTHRIQRDSVAITATTVSTTLHQRRPVDG
jgi:hypothetical protein